MTSSDDLRQLLIIPIHLLVSSPSATSPRPSEHTATIPKWIDKTSWSFSGKTPRRLRHGDDPLFYNKHFKDRFKQISLSNRSKKNQRNKLRVTETTLSFNAEKKRTNKIGLKKKMFIQIQQIIHHWNERSKFPGHRWRVRHVWDTCETRAAWHHLPRNRDRVVTSLCPVPRVCSPPPPPPRVIRWVSRRENLRHENTRSCVTCCKSIRLVWSVSKPPRCFTSARVYCSTV